MSARLPSFRFVFVILLNTFPPSGHKGIFRVIVSSVSSVVPSRSDPRLIWNQCLCVIVSGKWQGHGHAGACGAVAVSGHREPQHPQN